MKGLVNRIVDVSFVDGPGNRTAVFLQGCNFNCHYCHNPETIAPCNHCGACVSVCPKGALHREHGTVVWNQGDCVDCNRCLQACTHHASPKAQWMDVETLLARIGKNRPFIQGVTVSGGECTMQRDYLVALGRGVQAMGLTFFLDTNGSYPLSQDTDLLAVTDGAMVDVKASPEEAHRWLTGRGNHGVLKEVLALVQLGKLWEVRTVVSPRVLPNHTTVETVAKIVAPHQKIAPIRYKIIAYRPLGTREICAQWESPDSQLMTQLKELAKSQGMTEVVIV
ncbi:MAG: YjjW family glycine radical enzyme activase [Eubacteriales bacterium]